MADLAPLRPLRFAPELLSLVVAPPYDVIDADLRQRLLDKHPHNVVHIDLPEGEGHLKYEGARRLFADWQEKKVLVRDEAPAFWRYAQTFEPPGGGTSLTRKGFLALVRSVPFSERVILPHERTLDGPKRDRLELSRATRAALSPQFMLYSDPRCELDSLLDSGSSFAEFSTEDGVKHQISRVTAPGAISEIVKAMSVRQLLIADGHHRYETSVAISAEFEAEARARGIRTTPQSEHRFTYALLANGDDPSLVVFPTHRLVHSLARFDWHDLIQRAQRLFRVEPLSGGVDQLASRLAEQRTPALGAIARGGKAALLVLKPEARLDDHPVLGKRPPVLRNTGVALLHDALLEHVLGITPEAQAQKTNLKYLQDARSGVSMLERGEGQVLFLMNGTEVSTVRRVAEAGEVMPQKSTFFYPKVPTGLCFHTLRPDHAVC